MPGYFGTDGVRGRVNSGTITAETVLRIGMAAGSLPARGETAGRVVIGKDTRRSGYMIENALASGLLATGMDVFLLGPVPTPAVPMITRSMRADLGIMISASHNPAADNGIKIFGADGYKLPDAQEARIEAMLDDPSLLNLAPPDRIGRARRIEDAHARYIEYAKRTFPRDMTLDGLRIVIDAANGAAYKVAPAALWELGADVIPMGVKPDGSNINDGCGSTHPEALCRKVLEYRADIGIALDGDADRLIVVDEKGQVVDGDQLMALVATSWARRGELRGGGLVATIMSNLGLERHLAGEGLTLHRTRVGDRHVVEAMRARGFNLGGEQSGHIVMSDVSTTGDGLLAALQVLAEVKRLEAPASAACNVFSPIPQVLRSVTFTSGTPLEHEEVRRFTASARQRLSSSGRLVVRPSGTERLIRVMAEGEDAGLVHAIVSELCGLISRVAA